MSDGKMSKYSRATSFRKYDRLRDTRNHYAHARKHCHLIRHLFYVSLGVLKTDNVTVLGIAVINQVIS